MTIFRPLNGSGDQLLGPVHLMHCTAQIIDGQVVLVSYDHLVDQTIAFLKIEVLP